MRLELVFSRLLLRVVGRERAEAYLRETYCRDFAGPAIRSVIRANLSRIRAHRREKAPSEEDVSAVAAEMASIHACVMVDMSEDPSAWGRLLQTTDVALLPALESCLAAGKGAILATPHFGNHTRFLTALTCLGRKVHVMFISGAPFRSVEERVPNIRFLDVGSSALDCLRALSRNELVLLLDDVDYFPDNRTADFFGAPFSPPHGPARLSLASGAPILPVYSLMTGARWRLVCDTAIQPVGLDQADIESLLLRSMEAAIGSRPGHWLLFRDAWDLEGNAEVLRRQLREVRVASGLSRFWEKLKGPFRGP